MSDPKPTHAIRAFDVDHLIDGLVRVAKAWSDDGIDLHPDGVEQLRTAFYRVFNVDPPREPRIHVGHTQRRKTPQ